VLRSLATLAYDCRRSERFRKELIAALKIIERGDLTPDNMIGSWAGELGQTQFLPSHYFNYGVDLDGNGKVDLLRSVPDVLATSAHYIQKIGWRRGEPWMQEVRVPERMDWSQASLDIEHPHAQWSQVGGHARKRQAACPRKRRTRRCCCRWAAWGLPFSSIRTSAYSRNGIIRMIYSTTASYLATRIAGAPVLRKGNGDARHVHDGAGARVADAACREHGYDVGGIDGRLGALLRARPCSTPRSSSNFRPTAIRRRSCCGDCEEAEANPTSQSAWRRRRPRQY
jgi:hypothetical protein